MWKAKVSEDIPDAVFYPDRLFVLVDVPPRS
jgi:K+-sensing histidine kinase KdpD